MSVEFIIPRHLKLNDIRLAIKTKFPIIEEAPASLIRHYQDSFDWLLYQNKQQYFVEPDTPQYSLYLQSLNQSSAPQQVSQPTMPQFVDQVQSVVLRRKLSAAIDIRALMTHLTLKIKRHTLRYVDDDEKTRLFIHIEDYRIQLANGKNRELGKRIRLQAVKGYASPVTTVSNYLTDRHKLLAAEQTTFQQALAAVELDPEKIIRGVPVDISVDMRTDQALKNILKPSLHAMQINRQGIIDDLDSEFLHDYRVAVRRTRSALSLIKQVFPQRVVDRFKTGFKWLGSVTGPTRDIHVYLLKFASYQAELPVDMQPHLEPMRVFLQKHLGVEHSKLVRAIKSKRHQQLLQAWADFLASPAPGQTTLENAAAPVRQTADHHIWAAFRKVIKQGSKISTKSPDEKLHQLRISCKKLRYLLEFFAVLYPPKKFRPLIKSLKQLQNILGDFQDLSVQVESINHIQTQMQEENMMTEQTARAMALLNKHFLSQKSGLRKQYAVSFAEFSAQQNQQACEKLFHPVVES